eukprot:s149_g23.t1
MRNAVDLTLMWTSDAGGWTQSRSPTPEDLAVWNKVITQVDTDLASMGQPVEVSSQVVSGIKKKKDKKDKKSVKKDKKKDKKKKKEKEKDSSSSSSSSESDGIPSHLGIQSFLVLAI